MKDLTPNKSDLDPIEIASRDEIMALQLTRMKTTLKHAYDNVSYDDWNLMQRGGMRALLDEVYEAEYEQLLRISQTTLDANSD